MTLRDEKLPAFAKKIPHSFVTCATMMLVLLLCNVIFELNF